MRSVANRKFCYGCGACAVVCPKKCVSLNESAEGFYVPEIDKSECVNCGLCEKACPMRVAEPKADVDLDKVKIFGAWAKDEETLAKSSSGGVVMSLAKILVEKGFKLVGVKYAPEHVRAEHFIAETLEDFKPSLGSKYVQSFTETAFKNLDRNGKYLIVGTPCQVFALRPLFPNAFFVDFWCHGVPSALLWRSFLKWAGKGFVPKKIDVVWRAKECFGWQNGYCAVLKCENKKIYAKSNRNGDPYSLHFLRCNAQNRTCYTCPFGAYNSAADVRVGDFWGEAYAANTKGVSKIALMTEAARALESELCDLCVLEPVDEDVKSVKPSLFPEPPMRSLFLKLLKIDFRLAHGVRRAYDIWLRVKRLLRIAK